MMIIDVQEADARLSDLLARVERGEEVIIARSGSPVARLVLVGAPPPRRFGGMTLTVPNDFDAPLDEDEPHSWG